MEKHTKNGIKCWNLGFFQQRFLYLCLVFLLVSMTSVWAGNTIETTFANVKTLKLYWFKVQHWERLRM